jgi:hypothetical protein
MIGLPQGVRHEAVCRHRSRRHYLDEMTPMTAYSTATVKLHPLAIVQMCAPDYRRAQVPEILNCRPWISSSVTSAVHLCKTHIWRNAAGLPCLLAMSTRHKGSFCQRSSVADAVEPPHLTPFRYCLHGRKTRCPTFRSNAWTSNVRR